MKSQGATHIAHVIYRLDIGGLENGLVNIINRLPEDEFRHSIICLAGYNPEYARRIKVPVEIFQLDKKPGHDFGLYWRLFKLFRRLRPDILHTRNLGTLEAQIPGFLAGVKARVHGLHGWDIADIDGSNTAYLRLYRVINPLVRRYVALSQDLAEYLRRKVGVRSDKIQTICNGVDTEKYRPLNADEKPLLPENLRAKDIILGTVGRMESVKDPLNLVNAVILLLQEQPELREKLALVMVGDGSLKAKLTERVRAAGIEDLVYLTGSSARVDELLRSMQLFVLPSKAEGISNTILEAMASGLAVIATRVGGNAQLVVAGKTGTLVARENHRVLAHAIASYVNDPEMLKRHATAGRRRALEEFSLDIMVEHYRQLYSSLS